MRWSDHLPVHQSTLLGIPTLYFTLYEPSLFNLPQYDERHVRFIADSVEDMNSQVGKKVVYFFHAEAIKFFKILIAKYDVVRVLSHKETGIKCTFDRDIAVKKYLQSQQIEGYNQMQMGCNEALEIEMIGLKTGTMMQASPL